MLLTVLKTTFQKVQLKEVIHRNLIIQLVQHFICEGI